MNRAEFDALDARIRDRANRMWQDAGSPDGDRDSYLQNARELIAMEEVALPKIDPYQTEMVEEAILQRNLGEFPTLRDQGDEQVFPDDANNSVQLSDGDASEQGGVLPDDDVPTTDLPDVPSSDADITSDWPEDDADIDLDTQVADDINDDGLPDLPPDLPPARRTGR